jgi:SAM-dependent methyltransferase
VSSYAHAVDVSRVTGDESGLYGREYWFSHMENDLGFVNIYERVRTDLEQRCPYWLRALLKYRTPPGSVLELGCAHGAFVAILRWAGFDASGLELSPEIVAIARELFEIPVLQGPIEDQHIAPGAIDVIVLMDVLEHLPDPVSTMRYCLDLLAPGGMLLIQTPSYPSGKTFDDLRNEQHHFVDQLKEQEHLYLFNPESITRFFEELGCRHLTFEPALFGHYDMFLAVSREALQVQSAEVQTASLSRTPGGRLVQAMLDLVDRRQEADSRFRAAEADVNFLTAQIASSEADRTARLEVIERQGAELADVPALRHEVEALKAHVAFAEADRAARLEIIERQGTELGDVPALRHEVEALKAHVAFAEADRAARLEIIERQGAELAAVPMLRTEIEQLRGHLAFAEADRAARLEVIEKQAAQLGQISAMQADINYLTGELISAREQVQTLDARLAVSETARASAVESLEEHQKKVARLDTDLTSMEARIQGLDEAVRRRSGWRRFWF